VDLAPGDAIAVVVLADYRRSDARIAENGSATSSGVSNSAKVVLGFAS
jgi:hypothetical protein